MCCFWKWARDFEAAQRQMVLELQFDQRQHTRMKETQREKQDYYDIARENIVI